MLLKIHKPAPEPETSGEVLGAMTDEERAQFVANSERTVYVDSYEHTVNGEVIEVGFIVATDPGYPDAEPTLLKVISDDGKVDTVRPEDGTLHTEDFAQGGYVTDTEPALLEPNVSTITPEQAKALRPKKTRSKKS